jgi:uncharacterized membrane protein YhaH (DUF805 family)
LGVLGTEDHPNTPGGILAITVVAISIWLIIQMGFLKGTSGPNRFGPDPLARA